MRTYNMAILWLARSDKATCLELVQYLYGIDVEIVSRDIIALRAGKKVFQPNRWTTSAAFRAKRDRLIKADRQKGSSLDDLADKFNLSKTRVQQIVNRGASSR